MSFLVPMIPLVALLALLATLFIVISRKKSKKTLAPEGKPVAKLAGREKAAVIKEATKRLAQNPRDPEALFTLAEVHFSEEDYEKAANEYEILVGLAVANPSLNERDMNVRYALSALNAGRKDQAYEALVVAKTMKDDEFDVNYNLGVLEYERKSYERAVTCLTQARVSRPEHPGTIRYLGHALFKAKRFAEATALLRKSLDNSPDDKESMFAIARSYHEIGHDEQALKIFSHLRADEKLGPHAALFAGTIHLKTRQYEQAIVDFQIGLRHDNIAPELTMELKYRLAVTFIKQQDIAAAIGLLQEISRVDAEYKDVAGLLNQYRELNSNENLRVFLISQTSEFITLCRKIAISFFSNARAKVTDVSIQRAEYADILTDVISSKGEETVLFRFVRTTGTVGELVLRDFYSRIKETRAGRGYCLIAGTYTEGARHFVEGRLIDLIDKDVLMSRLQSIGR